MEKEMKQGTGQMENKYDDGRPEQTVFTLASKDAKWLVLIKGGWAE